MVGGGWGVEWGVAPRGMGDGVVKSVDNPTASCTRAASTSV